MRQVQTQKQAEYSAAIARAAKPAADRFILRLEGSLQRAKEAKRPQSDIRESFNLNAEDLRTMELDAGFDTIPFLNAVKGAVTAAFGGGPRNFTVKFEDFGPSASMPNGTAAILTW